MKCKCGDRAASECPGEWEEGCALVNQELPESFFQNPVVTKPGEDLIKAVEAVSGVKVVPAASYLWVEEVMQLVTQLEAAAMEWHEALLDGTEAEQRAWGHMAALRGRIRAKLEERCSLHV